MVTRESAHKGQSKTYTHQKLIRYQVPHAYRIAGAGLGRYSLFLVNFGSTGSIWFHMSWNAKRAVKTGDIGYGSIVPCKNSIHKISFILCRWSIIITQPLKFAEPWNRRQVYPLQSPQAYGFRWFHLLVPHRGKSVEQEEPACKLGNWHMHAGTLASARDDSSKKRGAEAPQTD